jgi:hypothetical protein
MKSVNLNQYTLPSLVLRGSEDGVCDGTKSPRRTEGKRKVDPYLRGPIPWWWLVAMQACGKAAMIAGLSLWHLRALRKSETIVTNHRALGEWFGASEKVIRQGLHALEKVNLIVIERPVGRSQIITLIPARPEKDPSPT